MPIDRSLVAEHAAVRRARCRRSSTRSCPRRARPDIRRTARCSSRATDAHSFFVLLHGHVRASKMTPAGQQVVVRYVTPGEIFGVAKAIGLTKYPATATAVDDSVVLAWPSAAWPRLVAQHPVAGRQHAADRRQPAAGDAYARPRNVDRTGRAARRACAAAARQAGRPQGRAGRRDRFSRSAGRTSPK